MEDEVILCIYIFYIFDLFSLKQVAGSSPTNSSLELTHVSRAYDVTMTSLTVPEGPSPPLTSHHITSSD